MAANRPTRIGKYDVIDVIGRGGMGIVYKGRDRQLDRLVAIKMMTGSFSDHPDLLKRFYREAQSTASLQHRNIVTVYELGDQDGSPYLVMEYLDGESLDSILSDQRQLSLSEKLDLVLEICQGLSYAHQRGVVHRDIKPANIMVSKTGEAKIVDFGIAHFGDNSVTLTGQIVGSISYMSPEQVNGKTVDARTDIFSTGIVLYQLLTSALPFDGDNAASTLLKIVHEPPPPLKNFLSDYPPELDAILERALAKDRANRYPSADQLALDLGQVQAQLKQNLIAGYLRQARQHIDNNDLYGAKEELIAILKIDYQNLEASHLLRDLHEKIQALEISREVRELRGHAEEAFRQEQFENALLYVERALELDKKNVDMLELRERVITATFRIKQLKRALGVAESAHQAGDLDSAKQAIEEALGLAPNDTHIKALHRVIQRDWAERARQLQIDQFIEQARQEITSRKFTAALELLKQAEALAPAAPEIRGLIESARAAQQQERRRRELEAINREVEDALNRDDYETATSKADEGLKNFPEDRSLLKLKALAEKQRQAAKRKQFIDRQLAEARSLMEQGRSEELVIRLESALAEVGDEPRLHSLLLIVRENLRREHLEKRQAEYLQKAKEALRRKEHDQAVSILEAARSELEDAGEVEDLLQFAKEEAAREKRRRAVDAAADEARRLMAEQEYQSAIGLLKQTLETIPDEELRIILDEARRGALDYEKKFEAVLAAAGKLIETCKPGEAIQLLEAQPASFSKRDEVRRLRETARSEAQRLDHIAASINESREMAASEDYSEALRILRQCRKAYGSTQELERELEQLQQKQVEAATRAVEKALSDARILLNAAEYQAAMNGLRATSEQWAVVPASLRLECERVNQQAVNGLALQARAEIERQLAAGDLTAAADTLERTLTVLPGHRDLSELETLIRQENAQKADAETKLAEAQTLFQEAAWKPGAERLKHAFLAARRQPRIREAVLKTFLDGATAAIDSDWREAESLLLNAKELEANVPGADRVAAEIAARRREEAAIQCLEQAKRARAAGDLGSARDELARGLSAYPGERRLEDFRDLVEAEIRQQAARQQKERERIEKEAFLHQLDQRLEQEPRLEHRAAMLEDALARYPGDRALEQQLRGTKELEKRVSELAEEARREEDSKRYLEAIQRWEAVGNIYPRYPGLEDNLQRGKELYQEARAARKAKWIQSLERELACGRLDEAGRMLVQVFQEYPDDRQFASLEHQIEEAQKARTKAEKSLTGAVKAFAKARWQKGVESLCRAYETAPRDPVICQSLIAHLSEAFDSALNTDWRAANQLLASAGELPPAAAVLPSLRSRVDERKRQELVRDCLKQARAAQNQGDWQLSLRHVEQGLAHYPDHHELLELKAGIESHLDEVKQGQLRREAARQLEFERKQEAEKRRREQAQTERHESGKAHGTPDSGPRDDWLHQQETQVDFDQTQEWSKTRTGEQPVGPTINADAPASHSRAAAGSLTEPTVVSRSRSRPLAETGIVTPPLHVSRRVPVLRIVGALAAILAIVVVLKFRRQPPAVAAIPITVATDPPGATLRIGDRSCQSLSCRMEFPPGRYRVDAQRDGYQPFVGTLTVDSSAATHEPVIFVLQPVPLAPAAAASVGTLTVRAGIADALVFVDDVARGRTDPNGELSMQLEAKSYRIRLEKTNYQPSGERRVEILKGASRNLAFKLIPLRLEGTQSAQFELRGAPQDVEIWLAGTLLGHTDGVAPFRQTVSSGEQVLEVRRGSATRQVKENFPAGQTLSVEWSSIAPAEATSPVPSAAAIEEQDWQRVRATNDSAEIEAFLTKYPTSAHDSAAQTRLEELIWQQTNRDDLRSLQKYLARFPAGRNAPEAAKRVDDILWSQVDQKDRGALLAFLDRQPNSVHRQDAQLALEQIATQESQKQVLLKSLDLFNDAFKRQQPHELKEVWPSATDQYLQALHPPAGYKVVLRLQASADAEPVVSGSTAQVLCDLISDTTTPGGQTKENKKRVKVYLYKDGDRWLIRDPFGQ